MEMAFLKSNYSSVDRLYKLTMHHAHGCLLNRGLLYSFVPQVIGIILLIFICVGLVVYVIRESCQQEVEMQDSDVAELTVLRMSSLRTRTS